MTANDVRAVIGQAVARAESLGHPVIVSVTDREGNVLGQLRAHAAKYASPRRRQQQTSTVSAANVRRCR